MPGCQLRKSVLSGFPNTKNWIEKWGTADFFLTYSEVFGYIVPNATLFRVFDITSQTDH